MKKMFVIVSVIVFTLALGGCGSSKKASESDAFANAPEQAQAGDFGINDDSDSGKLPIKTVYFDYNSYKLSGNITATLDAAVTYLKENAAIQVRVEGHCDERGGAQYNLALGESRAKAIKNYLKTNGIEAKRIETASYGKERPVAFGHDESSWGQNRRGNFVITAK